MDIRGIALFLLIAGSACSASDRILVPQPAANQSLEYKAGAPYVASNFGSTTVVFSPDIDSRSQATLWFSVRNLGTSPITIFEGAVSGTSNGKSMHVLGAVELEKKEKQKKFWENLAGGLAAGANSYTAAKSGHTTSRSNHYGTANAYTRDDSIRIDYQGTTTTETYDPEANRRAVADANSRNSQMLANIRAGQASRSAALESSVLQTQTIGPGEAYSGFVRMKLPRAIRGEASMIDVAFSAGSDRHHFYVFLDGQPSQYQTAQIARSSHTEPEIVKVSTSKPSPIASQQPDFRPLVQPQPQVQSIQQSRIRQIEPAPPRSENWSTETIEIVNSNCISQLIGGRDVEEKSRTQFAFACICMTDKIREEISYDELVSASELSVEEQQAAHVNVLVRKRLKECAEEYFISLK